MKKTLQYNNIFAFIATVFINYISNTGLINNTTIGGNSDELRTLFTPAGFAFAIWGLIYLLLAGFIIYQSRSLLVKVRNDDFILKVGWWFFISCLANSLWVIAWLYGYIGLSLVFMFTLLFSLLKIVWNNKMELWDAPITTIAFLWWPFVIYSGWVTVASIANVSAFLTKIEWNGFGISETAWTVSMILVAGLINLLITWKRNMREFALVGAWALGAIASANQGRNETVQYTALVVMGILLFSTLAHAIKNRKSNPYLKLVQYLKK